MEELREKSLPYQPDRPQGYLATDHADQQHGGGTDGIDAERGSEIPGGDGAQLQEPF